MGLFEMIMQMLGMGPKESDAAGASKKASSAQPSVDDDGDDDEASDWGGPGDWAPVSWRTGDYHWQQAIDLDFEDIEESDPTPPSWHSKHHNPTNGYGTLHVIELNKILNGHHRRMFAVYGVPVGWGTEDAEKAEFHKRIDTIEAARDDDDDFENVLSEWGFLDEDHYEWVRERVAPSYADVGDLQDVLNKVTAGEKQKMQDRIQGELASELEPFEGVSLEGWAGAQAYLAQGGSLDEVLSKLAIDLPAWDRASAEWNARMSRDTTATVATVYGQAFSGSGVGPFAAAGAATADAMLDPGQVGVGGEEPFSFEKWIEVTEAQNAGVAQGRDPAEILASFGLTPASWGVGGGWWSHKFGAEAMDRLAEYNRLSEKYRAQYAAGDADADVEF